jgi:hypothetical protein
MVNSDDEAVRRWLERVIKATGLKATPLARAAGLSPSTLIRALDPNSQTTLERRSIVKIMSAFGVGGPDAASVAKPDPDLLVVDTASTTPLAAQQFRRRVTSRALELAGLLPGDDVVFDPDEQPRPLDIVVVAAFSGDNQPAVLLRLFDPPYAITRSMDETVTTKPLLIDNERARITAVAIRFERSRKYANR